VSITQTLTIRNTSVSTDTLDWSLYEGSTQAPLAPWSDNFDSYPTGQDLHGVGGWKGWANDPAASASTSATQARSAPNSVNINTTSDLVHEYSETSGLWTYTAWQYIPSGYAGQSYFILLNQYDDAGATNNWSTQICFDSSTGLVRDDVPGNCTGTPTLSIVFDQWVELRVEIDLDADTQAFYYNDQLLYTDTWTEHVSGGGITAIGAVDLFANGADPVYYDDLSLSPPSACDVPGDLPWLAASPLSGSVVAGQSDLVNVNFDSTGLGADIYTGTLCITSNDPATPLVSVPLTLTVEAHTYSVDLSGDQAAAALPGETVTYTLDITNTGTTADVFDLDVSSAWAMAQSATSVALDTGESTSFWVAVTAPVDALAGEDDMAMVTATSQTDALASDSAELTTTVGAFYGVELSGAQAGTGAPGEMVSYTLTITNTGGMTDTFDLAAAGTWTATLSAVSVTLGVDESATFTVEVAIPADAADGQMDDTTVTATSQGDAMVMDSATLTTTAMIEEPEGLVIYLPIVMKP